MTDHGGIIVTGSPTWLVEGFPAARVGDFHSCPDHGVTRIVSGSALVLIDGCPAARVGDATECGAVIITGAARSAIQ